MKVRKLIPMLQTHQFDETIGFYTLILGFTCGEKNDEWGWADLNNGEIEIMIARPNQHTPFDVPVFTGSFYFVVENIDLLWYELKDKCEIVYPIGDFEWEMREFAIKDNNGYMLQFGQDIKEIN